MDVHQKPEYQIYTLLRELAKTERIFKQDPIFDEVTFGEFNVLDHVAHTGTMAQSQLLELLSVEKSTATRLVEPLIEKGLLRKERSSLDARTVELQITSEGKKAHTRVWNCIAEFLGEFLSSLTKRESETMIASMSKFITTFALCSESVEKDEE